jgi:cell division FtsZ-interacting protein ZapD
LIIEELEHENQKLRELLKIQEVGTPTLDELLKELKERKDREDEIELIK